MEEGDKSKGKEELIIKAAEKIFSEKGFYSARVEEISEEAGVGKGTVYEYFDSKEDLFKKMLLHINQEYTEFFRSKIKEKASVTDLFKDIIKRDLEFMLERKSTAKLMFEDSFLFSKDMHEWMENLKENKINFLKEMLQKGISNGEFDENIDAAVVAHLLFGGTMSFAISVINGFLEYNDAEYAADNIVDAVLFGIRKI